MGLRLLLGLLWALGGSGSGLPGSPQECGAAWGARRAGGSCRRLREALGSSWHVTPRILEGNRTRSAAEAALGGFPARLQVALELEGEQLVLELEQNREGAPGTPALVYYLPNGTRVTQAAGPQGSCCYRGHIRGYPGSWASICACAGLSGLLVASENRSYGLEPDPQGPPGRHRAYRPRAVPPGPSSPTRPEPRRGKRDVAPEQPFVELVMVVDYAEFRRYPHLERIRTRVLEIISQVDTFYQPLGLRVALLAVEVWNQGDPFAVGPSARATLERFLTWRQKDLLPRLPHDNAQLLTGLRLEGAEVGMATQASMCSAARSGGVSMDHSVSVLVVASSVAHQLGHNLGMGHDGPERQCGCVGLYQERSCIMAPPTELMPGLSFSNCSRQDVARSLRRDWAWCLFNVPEPESLAGRPHCGNRLLERGEACDCGFPEECTDPCCDAGTCRLVPGAECAAGDACCQHCKLRQAGSVCRQARGECDLPEFCDGLSPRCPPNVHLQDGQPCAGGQAYCYGGTCPTYQGQCQELWGPDSGPVSDACLAALNARGDAQGHCGQHPNGSYAPCAQRDSACGRLQCQGGGAQGALEDGGAPGCRRTPPPPSEDVSDLAVAMSGTACGSGKACRGGQCRDVSELGGQACGTKCHGHGVCNNKGHCHCEEGWAPPTCASRGLGGSEDSGPVRALEQGGSALLPVTLLLLAVLLALGVWGCYAKRGGLPCRLCRLGKGTGCQYRISQTEPRGSDRPHPGPPRPPRPQSTELQMMPTSKPAPHGSARPDPPSKPLPPDPVPRGSQAVLWGRPPPPTRPLPADPVLTGAQPPGPARPPLRSDSTGPLLSGAEVSAVPSYGPQAMLLPSRPAPPPPAGHLQDT